MDPDSGLCALGPAKGAKVNVLLRKNKRRTSEKVDTPIFCTFSGVVGITGVGDDYTACVVLTWWKQIDKLLNLISSHSRARALFFHLNNPADVVVKTAYVNRSVMEPKLVTDT